MTRLGAQAAVPNRADVNEFLKTSQTTDAALLLWPDNLAPFAPHSKNSILGAAGPNSRASRWGELRLSKFPDYHVDGGL